MRRGLQLGRADYQRQYEPIWYGWPDGGRRHWAGGRDQGDGWQIPRPGVSPLHPTQKPLALVERAITNSSRPGDQVLDPFCGAGVLSELRARMTRSEAPALLPCLRRRHFGDQCMPAPDEASSLLGQGDDLAAATASAQGLAELLKRRAEACR